MAMHLRNHVLNSLQYILLLEFLCNANYTVCAQLQEASFLYPSPLCCLYLSLITWRLTPNSVQEYVQHPFVCLNSFIRQNGASEYVCHKMIIDSCHYYQWLPVHVSSICRVEYQDISKFLIINPALWIDPKKLLILPSSSKSYPWKNNRSLSCFTARYQMALGASRSTISSLLLMSN